MNLLKIRSNKKERKQYSEEGLIESLEGIATATIDSVKNDLVNDGSHEAWNELLLADAKGNESDGHKPKGGDLEAGHELDLSGVKEKAHEVTEAGRQFISEVVHAGEHADARQSQEIEVRMHQILIEIKKLSESSGELQKQVEVITMEQTGESVGIYHVNFLDKMLNFIHELRMKVDDSLAWFGALNSKKAARGYHSMAKKHGTSFTLSNERQVATQVG
jgi:hypothetical protein